MKNLFKGATVAGSLAAGHAMAAVPTEVSTALSDAKADGTSIAALVLGVIIAIAALKYARRAL